MLTKLAVRVTVVALFVASFAMAQSTAPAKPQARSGPLKPISTAVTPAADISVGTFGLNTGFGTYSFFGGMLGIGTSVPTGMLHIQNGGVFYETNLNDPNVWGFNYYKSRGTASAKTAALEGDSTGFFSFYGYTGSAYIQGAAVRGQVDGVVNGGSMPGRLIFSTTATGSTTLVERMRVNQAGNVGIGTASPTQKLHVVGNINATGAITGTNIAATYQDIAEWVPSKTNLEPGSVVIVDPSAVNHVTPSTTGYDTRVAGVVSSQPGLTLGIADETKEQISMTGRVRVKVDATRLPIRVGDLLVTSDKTGRAMRSEPMKVGGRQFHQPGTIIGKALEPLNSGEGEILVLLSLQ